MFNSLTPQEKEILIKESDSYIRVDDLKVGDIIITRSNMLFEIYEIFETTCKVKQPNNDAIYDIALDKSAIFAKLQIIL